jgi:hypothetical protein
MMTKEELAAAINGREYGKELTAAEELKAQQEGLLIVFGASDDLCELRGAIRDEVPAYNGCTVLINEDGELLQPLEDDDLDVLRRYRVLHALRCEREHAAKIQATFGDSSSEYSWVLSTELPHATFDIVEDGEKFCRGIVVDLKEIK